MFVPVHSVRPRSRCDTSADRCREKQKQVEGEGLGSFHGGSDCQNECLGV
jgi:hypothetical protein